MPILMVGDDWEMEYIYMFHNRFKRKRILKVLCRGWLDMSSLVLTQGTLLMPFVLWTCHTDNVTSELYYKVSSTNVYWFYRIIFSPMTDVPQLFYFLKGLWAPKWIYDGSSLSNSTCWKSLGESSAVRLTWLFSWRMTQHRGLKPIKSVLWLDDSSAISFHSSERGTCWFSSWSCSLNCYGTQYTSVHR